MRDKSSRGRRPRLARQTLRLYLSEAKKMPWHFTLSYLSSAGFVLFSDIAAPYLIGRLIDILTTEARNPSDVYRQLWLITGSLFMSHMVFARLTFWLRNRAITQTEKELNMLVFDAYMRQESSFYSNNFVGSLVARAQRFTSTFRELYDMTLFAVLNFIIQLIGPVIILAFIAPLLSVVFIVATLLTVLVIRTTGRYKSPILKANSAAGSKLTGELADSLSNNLAVKVFAAGSRERQRFFAVAEARRSAYFRQAVINEKVRIIRSVISVLFSIVSIVILSIMAMDNVISIGTVVLASLYLGRLEQSLWDLTRLSERIEESMADAAEMTEVIMRQAEVQDIKNPIELTIQHGDVAFQNVNFRYQDANEEDILFRNLALSIPAGQKVGLVGPSGGGKTTLTKLLLRFMDIQSGAITIDGQDITQARQNDVRSSIAYVPQEPLLFHRSIKENIAYGDPSASEDEVIKAAKLAHAHDFIAKLPQGYDTLVGERGVKLSGGEKQRVAIARAMLKKSPIVVLDEATSALDSKSEKAIVAALDNLMAGRTTIVIAHRLSTIRKLDRIVVLKDGKIVEDGTHAELLKENGLYAELWSHQSGEFLPEE